MFFTINMNVGFYTKFRNPAIALILALICAFLPAQTIVIFSAVLLLGHLYAVSLEVTAIAFVMILLMCLLFFRFSPKDSYALLLTPVLFMLKIPYASPIIMGLVGNPASAVAVGCGTVIYYLIDYVKVNSAVLSNMEPESALQEFARIVDGLIDNKEMWLLVAAFALTVIVVYPVSYTHLDVYKRQAVPGA